MTVSSRCPTCDGVEPEWAGHNADCPKHPRNLAKAQVSEWVQDYRDRLVKADVDLKSLFDSAFTEDRKRHLESKAEGVRLALSYLDEYLRR